MKNVAVLTIVGFFVFSIALTGCGKLSKKEFEGWRDDYVQKNEQEHSDLKNSVSSLDSKVDQQKTDLTESISQAKEEAIATSQQGDADTIQAAQQFAKEQDSSLRDDLTNAINMVAEKSQDFATSEDDKLRQSVNDLEEKTNSQADNLTKVQTALMEVQQDATAAKAVASEKPRLIATVHFASGAVTLNQAAKQELDKAITEIKANPDYAVEVSGHTDGSPVLYGKYRSNWDLSQARAESVVKYLKEQGVTNQIKAVGRAHTEPIAPVNTKDGRAMNRRAEIIIYPPGAMM